MHQLTNKKNKIVIYLIFLLILSTVNNKTLNNKKFNSIKINEIIVTGLSHNNNFQLVNKLNNLFYQNIFFVNRAEINKIISANNSIEEYTIRKIYPSKLVINIKQTKFIAKLFNEDEFLVGSNGKLILNETRSVKLPYIEGEFNSKEFLKLKKTIDFSIFDFEDFKSILFYSSKRWDLLTNEDILIKLPKYELLKSLNLANKIIKDNRFKNNKIIDLRTLNHLVIK